MAASESDKVYVCGRCGDFGASTLEELVVHMTNCGYQDIRKKDEGSQPEVHATTLEFFEESEHEHSENELKTASGEQEKEIFLEESIVSSPHSGYSSQIFDAGRTSPTPFLWNKKTALLLLKLLKSHKSDMESPYIRRKTVWQKIAHEMTEKYGYNVSGPQCENKFKNMSNRFRRVRENNLRPDGKSKQTCFLYNELDDYFRSDSRYIPRRESLYDARPKPKIGRHSGSIYSDSEYITSEPAVPVSESDTSHNENVSNGSEKEPAWVKKAMETFVQCHKENMAMQREFLNIFKQILEKQ